MILCAKLLFADIRKIICNNNSEIERLNELIVNLYIKKFKSLLISSINKLFRIQLETDTAISSVAP